MCHHQPILRGRGLGRAFQDGAVKPTIFRDVALDLYAGELCLLMGYSGCGKSTLMAVLSGLLRPDSGQVLVRGEDLWDRSERSLEQFRQRHMGFSFQGCNLFPALTARQQLEMVLRWGENASAAEARRRAEQMLTTLGLEAKKLDLRPAQLSGGEKQRVAIGRALVTEPALCFADEPTSALDWENGLRVVELLRAAARERGAAVLMVAHDERIKPYADRVFKLDSGGLTEESPRAGRSGHREFPSLAEHLSPALSACRCARRSAS